MQLVIVGDAVCLGPAGADRAAPDALPGAAEAIAQLCRADIAVALAAHWLAGGARTTLQCHARFLHELDTLGARLEAVFFWPEDRADAAALLRTAGERNGIDPRAIHAALADDALLTAAVAAGCRAHRIGPAPRDAQALPDLPGYADLAAFASILTARTAASAGPASAPNEARP